MKTIFVIQLVNYTLSFFMWMILGRVVLTLMIGNQDNFAVGLFQKVTDPVYRIARKIVPFAQESCISFISIFLIIVIRVSLIVLFSLGARK